MSKNFDHFFQVPQSNVRRQAVSFDYVENVYSFLTLKAVVRFYFEQRDLDEGGRRKSGWGDE